MFFRKKTEADYDVPQLAAAPTVIGRDTTVEGAVDSDGEVQVEGRVRGSVRASVCIVGVDGLVEGDIIADEVRVSGRVAGPIRGRHVHLLRGAQVDGDVVNQTLAMDGGAELNGAVWRSDDPLGANKQPSKPALTSTAPGSLFAAPLWPKRDNDDIRPLQAVRPKR